MNTVTKIFCKFRFQVMIASLPFAWPFLGGVGLAESPIAIHVTQQELKIWRERSISGPYRDDWQRIVVRADSFRGDPSSDFWPGNQTNQVWDAQAVTKKQQGSNFHPGRRRGDGLRDAGFAYLVTGNASYRDAVRVALVKQANDPGTDFANSSKWSPTTTILHYNNFEIANWLRKLAYGYSYIRPSLSDSDRNSVDRWFLNAATYWNQIIHNRAKSRFPNRLKDDYETIGSQWPGSVEGKTHWGGFTVYSFHDPWKNIAATHNTMVAVVGVLLNNQTLKNHAKRFIKEWLMFAVASDGTVVDQFRWNTTDKNPQQVAYQYAGTVIGSIVAAADHLARAGDTEMYNYKTSFGYFGWQGGPKSLLLALQRFAQLTIGERKLGGGGVVVYASQDSVLSSTEILGPGDSYATDIVMSPANGYYKDETVKTAYTRRLPSSPKGGGYDPWGGDWGTYPGIRLMFGQMEGLVLTYTKYPPPQSQSSAPNAPSGLEISP